MLLHVVFGRRIEPRNNPTARKKEASFHSAFNILNLFFLHLLVHCEVSGITFVGSCSSTCIEQQVSIEGVKRV